MAAEFAIMTLTEPQAVLRMVVAALAGGAIGWNRYVAGKPAGLRTHMLVSAGAALFVLIPLLVTGSEAAGALGRTLQGVATGIGFLGAGEIIHQIGSDRAVVQGLTAVAAIWLTAAIGMAAACGRWLVTGCAVALALIFLSGPSRLEEAFPPRHG